MYELAACSLGYVNEQNTLSARTPSPVRMLEYASHLQHILEHARPEIRCRESSKSFADNIERLALCLNTSYALATMLRPALKEEPQSQTSSEQRDKARKMCIDACMAAVDSFVNLHFLSPAAERSWAFTHNALSCALILTLLDEGSRSESMHYLQKKLLNIVSTSSTEADRASPLWGPHARILSVFDALESIRSAKPKAGASGHHVNNNISRAGHELPVEQEIQDARQLPLELDSPGTALPDNDLLSSVYFNDLLNFDVGDDGLVGMYDSILWGNGNNSNYM